VASTLKVPSKTFLLGEYAILETGCALLIGHNPYFEFHFSPGSSHPFPSGSPAQVWLEKNPAKLSITYSDPHRGKGGFGGSGAELLAAMEASGFQLSPFEIWNHTRDLPGSGADLLVQSYGQNKQKDFFLKLDLQKQTLEELIPNFQATLSIFHTGKKVHTHSHLSEKPKAPISQLDQELKNALMAWNSREAKSFGSSLNRTHDILREAKLQASHTCEILARLPRQSVLGAKGCGAMGSDVIVVFHQNASIANWAKENSLALITEISV
jgi:mevalonate kinase